MAYTNNVPQGNQTIATTQPIINANFQFIQTGVSVEHNFNASGSGSDMYHLKASMPNRALSPALPAGTNGIYFVSSGAGYFYDGTNNYQLSIWTGVLKGTFVMSGTLNTPVNVVAIPASVFGVAYFYDIASTLKIVTSGQFVSDGASVYGMSNLSDSTNTDTPVELVTNSGVLDLKAATPSSLYAGKTFNYVILYRPA